MFVRSLAIRHSQDQPFSSHECKHSRIGWDPRKWPRGAGKQIGISLYSVGTGGSASSHTVSSRAALVGIKELDFVGSDVVGRSARRNAGCPNATTRTG